LNDSAKTCPYLENTDEFRSWQEGWLYARDRASPDSANLNV
jgi:hypothetical protein